MIKDSEDYNIIGSRRVVTSLGKEIESILLSQPCEAKCLLLASNWVFQLQNLGLKVYFLRPF